MFRTLWIEGEPCTVWVVETERGPRFRATSGFARMVGIADWELDPEPVEGLAALANAAPDPVTFLLAIAGSVDRTPLVCEARHLYGLATGIHYHDRVRWCPDREIEPPF